MFVTHIKFTAYEFPFINIDYDNIDYRLCIIVLIQLSNLRFTEISTITTTTTPYSLFHY